MHGVFMVVEFVALKLAYAMLSADAPPISSDLSEHRRGNTTLPFLGPAAVSALWSGNVVVQIAIAEVPENKQPAVRGNFAHSCLGGFNELGYALNGQGNIMFEVWAVGALSF